MNFLMRIFDQMAKMGLAFRSDPIKVIEAKGREWGQVASGLDLSLAQRMGQSDLVSVILRNVEPREKTIVTPGWLDFFEIQVTSPDGLEVPLSPYGRARLKQDRGKTEAVVQLGPHEMVETELPIGVLYTVNKRGTYKVRVSCLVPSGDEQVTLTSNECRLEHVSS